MSKPPVIPAETPAAPPSAALTARNARLAAALRDNLRRRKAAAPLRPVKDRN
ncbi:hypothetical protein [uncultured Brevundimonas sp.]|uniref:hypothetical protein n=1 Tax=uncultured Brevundimonas sp. TaxID=213418 RepID=UPI0030EBD90F